MEKNNELRVIVIDPQSIEGLASYDNNLCTNIPKTDVTLIGNKNFDYMNKTKIYDFYPFFNYQKYKQPAKTINYFFSINKTTKFVIKKKPNLIHLQWLKLPKIDSIFLKKIRKKKIPIVYTVHNLLPHDDGKRKYKVFKYIYNKITDKLIVHTQITKDRLMNEFGIKKSKICIIPHGLQELSTDRYKLDLLKEKIRNRLPRKSIIFSFIGTLTAHKGIDIIEEAWENSMKLNKDNEIVLLIAGQNKFSNNIIHKLNKYKNVYLNIKKLSNEEFEAYLELSDVILLPYRRISQSGVLLSSINRSKPFIVSNVGGLTDPFKIDKNCGWIMNELNWKSLEKTILQAKYDIKKSSEKFYNSEMWKKLHNEYSWSNIGYKTYLLYKSII